MTALVGDALHQGPVVQSIVSLTSLLVVEMLTVLVSAISKSQVFLLKKNVGAFANAGFQVDLKDLNFF